MSIQRFDPYPDNDGQRPMARLMYGEYVLYVDHAHDLAAMQARAERAEATLQQWRKAYSRNILSHDEEEDDEAAHLHAVACADQAMREGDQ